MTRCVLLLFLSTAAWSQTADFYVAPNGSDTAPGTLTAPFATLDRARFAVRALKQSNPARATNITVALRGGTYYLTAPLTFSAADSGTAAFSITYTAYPGETPILSGAITVHGFTQTAPGVWTAYLPASTPNFEQLYVNGERRYRPRANKGAYLYNAGPVYVTAPEANCSIQVSGKGYLCFDRFKYTPGDLSSTYYDITNVEIDDFEKWTVPKLRLKSIDSANHIAYLTGPTARDLTNHGWLAGHRYLVENVKEALSQPGQWYLDRLASPHALSYIPRPGEDMTVATVEAPQLSQLLVANGLEYVTFSGLTFEHDNWTVPAAGNISTQGEPNPTAALSFNNSRAVTFNGCTVAHTAGWGIEFIGAAQGSAPQGNKIVSSAFYDIGAGGIRIGHTTQATDTETNVAQNNLVSNNVVAGGGRFVPDGVGIWQGNSHHNTYSHNDVFDWYHSGFEVCVPTPAGCALAHDISISENHVRQIGQGVTSDLAGIYIATYDNPNVIVIGNRIHDVTHNYQDSDGYGGQGIYFDNETSGAVAQFNNVYRTSAANYFNNLGVNNTASDNIFAYPYQGTVQRGQTMLDGSSFRFIHNIVFFRSAPQRQSNWTCTNLAGTAIPCASAFQFDNNLYWNPSGAAPSFILSKPSAPAQYNTLNFSQWQQQGQDTHSIVADPLFQDPTYPADDYRLRAGSPAAGIVSFLDLYTAGQLGQPYYPPALDPAWPLELLDPVADYRQPASAAAPLDIANAASYARGAMAPAAIVAAFGSKLAGNSVTVRDSAGTAWTVPTLYTLPSQIALILPTTMAAGPATITMVNDNHAVSSGNITIASVSPALFSADFTGSGPAAANYFYANNDTAVVLYGTGIRGRTSLSAVTVNVAGTVVAPFYAGPQPTYPGLDQVNFILPHTLPPGPINVTVTVDGHATNTVVLHFSATSASLR